MDLKFYLNKILKVDNIENYTLKSLDEMKKKYDSFLESTDGIDPDFPNMKFGGGGKKVAGRNAAAMGESLADLF